MYCLKHEMAWAGGASESAQAPGGTWVGYEFIMDVSVACVEIGAVHSQNQYVQQTSSFRGTISASGTFTPASSTLERSIRATR